MNTENKSLNCPFCCNETFNSVNDLKNHISNVINKLCCPICMNNFDNLNNFASHVVDCELSFTDVEGKDISSVNYSKEQTKNNYVIELNDNPENLSRNEKEYYCEICDVYFEEMKKHLTEHHIGQEVVVESHELDQVLDHSVTGIDESSADGIQELLMDSHDSEQIFVEQEVLDETGTFLTKKLTKINIVQETSKKQPIIEYVSFLNGVITLTNEEERELENSMKVYRCPNCNSQFAQSNIFTKHVCNSGDGEICEICSIRFSTKGSLAYHKRKLHKEIRFVKEKVMSECDMCHIVFPSIKSLNMHIKMHRPIEKERKIDPPVTYNITGEKISDENNEMFTCNVCGKIYNKKYEKIHVKSHVEENFNCVICNRKFIDKIDLNMHAQAHGSEIEKKISCRFCKKIFTTKNLLEGHIENHCEAQKYSCNYCGRKFSRPHEKVKHERIHTGLKPHVCELCGKRFRVSYCLTLHLRTHSGVRPYHCETCGKRFKSLSSFKHHIQIHSDARPHKCPFCPKAFKTMVQLGGHKNSHTKPFSCNVCNRPFASLYAVRIHRKSHDCQNNLNYQCHICGAYYARNFALRDHIRTHPEHTEEDLLMVPMRKSKKEQLIREYEIKDDNSLMDYDDDSKVVVKAESELDNDLILEDPTLCIK